MCMWDGCGDSPEVYRCKVQQTRKERKCDECRRVIAVGEPYQNVFTVYDKEPSTWIMCQHCLVAATWLVDNCGGYVLAGVWQDIHEHISEYRGPSEYRPVVHGLQRLEVGAQRQWQRFDHAGLMALQSVPPVVEGA
jgi:hypothetical protein